MKRGRIQTEEQQQPDDDEHQRHRGARSEDLGKVLQAAVRNGLIRTQQAAVASGIHQADNDEVVLFYDLDAFESSLDALNLAFPAKVWRHCLAVKANPLISMLKMAVQKGFGLECASIVEVELSVRAGCPCDLIVFDSPCKTMTDLRRALQLGVQVNCDGLEEVDRVRKVLVDEGLKSNSVVGIRVNPLLGMGQIKALSVSDATSKFGVPFTDENRTKIIQLFKENSFLNALHVHVGSQGCSLEMLATGAATIYQLAEKELGGSGRIKVLDIGGGLPTNFSSDETKPSFQAYSQVLQKMVPELFNSTCQYRCFTEFGRSMQAKLGWTASICELVKEAGGRRIVVVHVGSDMFVRTCYCPADFPLRVQVVDGTTFHLKTLENSKDSTSSSQHNVLQNVVGPLCFGGDKICEAAILPIVQQNDYVVIRDSGANCLSLWSRHCSRPSPAVYGYRISQKDDPDEPDVSLTLLRRKESISNILEFWE